MNSEYCVNGILYEIYSKRKHLEKEHPIPDTFDAQRYRYYFLFSQIDNRRCPTFNSLTPLVLGFLSGLLLLPLDYIQPLAPFTLLSCQRVTFSC